MDKETKGQGSWSEFLKATQFLNDGAGIKAAGIWLSVRYQPLLF